MEGYLEKVCVKRGIQVKFTKGKFLELEEYVDEDLSEIRVNKIFEDCPKEVAEAVIACCMEQIIKSENIKIIEDYLKDSLGLSNVKIEVPKGRLGRSTSGKSTSKVSDGDGYIEADISRIAARNMWGEQANIGEDGSLIAYEDDILELNIVVEPPVT